jgi:hypothetical protein
MQVVEKKRVSLVYAGKALREGSGSDFHDSTIRKTVEKETSDPGNQNLKPPIPRVFPYPFMATPP